MEEVDEIRGLIAAVVESDGKAARPCYDRYKAILTKYQEQPQLLDGCLESIVQPLAVLLRQSAMSSTVQDTASVQDVCRLLHVLITVRGYKTVVRFFPHEAADLEKVLQVLAYVKEAQSAADSSHGDSGIALWEAQAVLLLWLSILVLIPFDLFIVDSSVTDEASEAAAKQGYTPLAAKMMQLCQEYLAHPGAVREMAALLLARLLTRPDMSAALRHFLTWQQQALLSSSGPSAVFLLPGILQTLALIFKLGRREQLLPLAAGIWQQLADLIGDSTTSCSSASTALSSNMLARKLAVKLAQRVGLTLLPPQLAGWRYVRTAADLGKNLGADSAEAVALSSHGVAAEATAVAAAAAAAEFEVPEEIEDVIGVLLSSCSDKDTVVRWSAAKGVGRLAGCLPLELAEEVVDGALGLLSPSEPDSSWHGGCLAIAELARRSILAPDRLDSVTGLLQQALAYDVRRGPHSVGAHVRDAAAYVCWALARAYDPAQLSGCVTRLATSLLIVACYDREVNCRRAAASAFQECVGRLGSFPHGLEILAVADYFTVGSVSSAYLRVAPFIAAFPEYTNSLIEHLLSIKLYHWDKALRALAAMGLASLAPVAAQQLADSALSKLLGLVNSDVLEVRTGAVVGLAELLPALSAAGCCTLTSSIAQQLVDVLTQLESAGMYRGKGGEVMREAAARFVEQTAAATGGLTVVPLLRFVPNKRHQAEQDMLAEEQQQPADGTQRPSSAGDDANSDAEENEEAPADGNTSCTVSRNLQQQQRLHLPLTDQYHQAAARLLLDCLSHVQNSIQASGVAALRAHTRAFQSSPDQQQQLLRLVDQCCCRLRDRDVLPAARRGAAAALGVLPGELVLDQAGALLQTLATAAQAPLDPVTGFDIETHIAAVSSLAQLTLELLNTQTLALAGSNAAAAPAPAIAAATVTDCVCPALLAALDDYTRDNRGDVGSWVREAAMDGLAQVTLALGTMVQQQQRDGEQQQEHNTIAAAAAVLAQGAASLSLQEAGQQWQQQQVEGYSNGHMQPTATPPAPAGSSWSAAALQLMHQRLSLLVVNGLLRHALERIARLRESALLHLQSLLTQQATSAAVPAAAAITAALPGDAVELVGVASLAGVARLAALLQLQWYRLALLEGLVACIGGVDASLAKAATKALLAQVDVTSAAAMMNMQDGDAAQQPHAALRRDVAGLLLKLWRQHAGSTRLSLPLIKTAAFLCTHANFGAIQVAVPADENSPTAEAAADGSSSNTFAWAVLQLLKQEIRGCGDVAKLLEGAALLAQLACVTDCSAAAMQSVMVLLVNRFPKVRRYMAEQLYLQLLAVQADHADGDAGANGQQAGTGGIFAAVPGDDLEAAMDALLVSAWDGPLEQVRVARQELAEHLHIEIKTKRVAKHSEGAAAPMVPTASTAEHESYQSLLDDAARGGGY